MEILSTGEKIKRARIYKGCTLKNLCEDKISVSKMSCIENDKVKAELWILEFIAPKLDLELAYLIEGIHEQIEKNIEILKTITDADDYEKNINYNLEEALQYEYYDLAFSLMHMFFDFYFKQERLENIQVLTSKYYEICIKSKNDYNTLLYHKDMARYFYMNKEYSQASAYYKNVIQTLRQTSSNDYELLARVIYNDSVCSLMLNDHTEAYKIALQLIEIIDYVEDELIRADMYHLLAILSIKNDWEQFKIYELKSYELYKQDYAEKANAIYNFASYMFKEGFDDKAIEYIHESLHVFPSDNVHKKVQHMLECINDLVEKNVLEEAQVICDEALNNAITINDVKLIEQAYYFKAKILQKQNNYYGAEVYMNLSMDALMKFGNRIDMYKRYMEFGNMYYKLGQLNDSLRYFSLAISLEKKM